MKRILLSVICVAITALSSCTTVDVEPKRYVKRTPTTHRTTPVRVHTAPENFDHVGGIR